MNDVCCFLRICVVHNVLSIQIIMYTNCLVLLRSDMKPRLSWYFFNMSLIYFIYVNNLFSIQMHTWIYVYLHWWFKLQLILLTHQLLCCFVAAVRPVNNSKRAISRHASFEQLCAVSEQEINRLYFESKSQPTSPSKANSGELILKNTTATRHFVSNEIENVLFLFYIETLGQ